MCPADTVCLAVGGGPGMVGTTGINSREELIGRLGLDFSLTTKNRVRCLVP